ncbi:MAG: protein phosphatase 2C domain-containing protein [Oligoflexia bacterium]|nr:protein phosphatase 2C domain-containing protein [Oligoflexia bacterium]
MLLGNTDKRSQPSADTGADNPRVPAAITDTGCERHLNEDRYAVIESPSGVAWFVCDGMGGEAGGELAAQLAIDAIRRDLETLGPRNPDVALKSAMLEANRVIVLRRQNQAFAAMGTTAVGVLFSGPEVVIAHAGDSRAYLVRDGAIQQLTTDHTFVQKLVESGQIKAEEALSHPQAHVLTRAIGAEPGLEVDLRKFWIWQISEQEPHDCLLLCTDGLYSLVSEGELGSIIADNTPQRACISMIELAKSRGGFDNITCAIIPLPGQMRQEPPIGYESGTLVRTASRKYNLAKGEQVDFVKLVRNTVILSLLAILLTVVAVIFSIGR